MATVNQDITLEILVADMKVVGDGTGTVLLTRTIITAEKIPKGFIGLVIDPVAMQYKRDGVDVWPLTPAVLTGPGADSLGIVIVDMAAAASAGVFNL